MQPEAAKVLGRCCIRRAAEKGCKGPDVADIVVASLLAEIAHAHVFDHALAQWTDGLLAHRGAPVLRWRLLTPLNPQDGTPSCHRIRLTRSHASAATRSGLRAQRAPAQRVRSMPISGRWRGGVDAHAAAFAGRLAVSPISAPYRHRQPARSQ